MAQNEAGTTMNEEPDTHVPCGAQLRFCGSLNDFLKHAHRHSTITYPVREPAAIKDVIEALGVPHPEVDMIASNGCAVDFGYLLRDGDVIQVFPVGDADRPAALAHLSLRPSPAPCFVLDAHLGTLARRLRMLGFDTRYRNDYDDVELAQISGTTGRILLTRDRGLLKRGAVLHGYYVRMTDPRMQVSKVLERFKLHGTFVPFGRCTRCNGELEVVALSEIVDQVPPKTRAAFEEFRRCVSCARIYWPGSHFEAMRRFIDEVSAR
jgi:uncharacterized protein with PIN domain